MACDDQDDLFGEDFDFVDEDDYETSAQPESAETEEEVEEEVPAKSKRKSTPRASKKAAKPRTAAKVDGAAEDESEEQKKEPEEPPGPPADHSVHVYEFGKFKRTIVREFTSDEAAAFVAEFNRTSSVHSREAVAASRDEKPAPSL